VGTAMIYNNFGFMYQSLSNNNEAIKNFLIASELKKEMGDMKGVGVYYYAIGALYRVQGNYPQALKYEIAALKIQEKLGDKHDIAYAYDIIGTIYEQQENHPLALTYFTNSLKTYEEIVDKQSIVDKQGIAAEVNNIGVVYFDQHNYTEALKNELKASTMFKEIGDSGNLASNYLSIGDIYSQQGNYPEALKKYSEALKIKEKIGDKGGILESYKSLGRFYKKQGNLHEALKSESKAISLALEIDSKEQIKDVYGELAVIDAGLQNYKAAYDHEVLFKQYYDSIYNKENDKKLTSLQMQYDFDKKEQTDSIQHASENKINSLNLHKQKVLTGLGISGFILVILLLFFVYRNYTNQRKATAEMTIARQRAEQSEKFKEQFLANMSHEIRTPMNAVMGMTSLVMDSLLNEKQRFYLEGIMKSGETLLYIINDILDLSKIEAGKMEIENIDFSVSEVLEQVKQTLQHKAEEKGLQLIVDMDGKITDVRMGDPVRLNQVLMNLAGNAIKFTEKGSVAIEVKKGVSESGIRFSINDTGIGIPEDKLQTVFESFSQAKASDTRTYGGTGLGLTISKQLVELMDGKISVESKEGSGTTFSFEINFPFGSPERLKEQRSAEQIEGSILNGLKILLADDNEYNRIVTHDTLTSKANVEIKEVTNGKEAIDLLSQQDFDVVLMDVQMPLMDGYEATRFIREHFAFPKNQTPVIALTASVIRSDLDKCREAGMNDYIPKPFKASQLISVIAKVTQREIRFSVKSIPGVKNETENDKVTDLGYLKEFCEGDKERMQKYIVMFLASAPYIIDYINIALNNKDYPEIVSQMHGNKTKLVMMGMNKTKDLAAEIEMRCREGKSPDDLKEKVLTFVKQIQKAVTELKEV
jgi:signal transduction histidine kinase/DNA-binding NarL/FixJ family response regulator